MSEILPPHVHGGVCVSMLVGELNWMSLNSQRPTPVAMRVQHSIHCTIQHRKGFDLDSTYASLIPCGSRNTVRCRVVWQKNSYYATLLISTGFVQPQKQPCVRLPHRVHRLLLSEHFSLLLLHAWLPPPPPSSSSLLLFGGPLFAGPFLLAS